MSDKPILSSTGIDIYFRMIRSAFVILALLAFLPSRAQDTVRGKAAKHQYPYSRKEEIIYDGKRYRIHNNYVTLGGGPGYSSIRSDLQQVAGVDFQFHIRREYFQAGVVLSGFQFFANNHIQLHAGYGKRKETSRYNLACFGGPSFYQGVEGAVGQPEVFYGGAGLYVSAQAVRKLTYDVGAGLEVFADLGFRLGGWGREQILYGAKLVVFFSGSYRGPKRNYNPNVRSENPNG